MLLASPIGGAPRFLERSLGCGDCMHPLSGLGADSTTAIAASAAGVLELQKALVELSKAKSKSAIDPSPEFGLVNGTVPDKTMSALAAAISSISPNDMPSWLRVSLGIALSLGATSGTAKTFVLQNTSTLTKAVKATTIAAIARNAGQTTPAPTTETTPMFSTTGAWYKTWWGIGAIAVGVVGVGSLLFIRRNEPAKSAGVAGYRRRRRR